MKPVDLSLVRSGPSRADETNHRIANQLAMIVSSIGLRANAITRGPAQISREDVLTILQVITGRLVSVGELNRSLSSAGDDHVNLHKSVIGTCAALVSHLSLSDRVAVVHRLNDDCLLTADQAQALAILITEIIVNAVKHAHPAGLPVTITVACDRTADGGLCIEIGDDGVGLPESFDKTKDGGVGFRVIHAMADKLVATLQIESDSLGLTFRFLIPAAEISAAGGHPRTATL